MDGRKVDVDEAGAQVLNGGVHKYVLVGSRCSVREPLPQLPPGRLGRAVTAGSLGGSGR